jgi:hypothetical protein
MFNESEIINLLLGIAALFILFSILKNVELPHLNLFQRSFTILLFSYVFTVVEGVCYKSLFDFLEHLGYALSGISFSYACWKLSLTLKSNERKDIT